MDPKSKIPEDTVVLGKIINDPSKLHRERTPEGVYGGKFNRQDVASHPQTIVDVVKEAASEETKASPKHVEHIKGASLSMDTSGTISAAYAGRREAVERLAEEHRIDRSCEPPVAAIRHPVNDRLKGPALK